MPSGKPDKHVHAKQRHTAIRILERLRDEHGLTGGYTIVRNYIYEAATRQKEMFMSLAPPAWLCLGRFWRSRLLYRRQALALSLFLPRLAAWMVALSKPIRPKILSPFWMGTSRHLHFWAVCRNPSCTTTPAVARILGDGKRKRTRAFSELQSHYLFEDKFGRSGTGNDKGNVEGLVGYSRRHFMVPRPVANDFDALNARLLEGCIKRSLYRRTCASVLPQTLRARKLHHLTR